MMDNESQHVVVTDIKMPFFSMVVFMIKWALALIPAAIVIGIIFGALGYGAFMLIDILGLNETVQEFLPKFLPPPPPPQ
jgi:hypothetical protein